MAKLLDLSVYGPGHISNILQVDASVYAKAFVTDGGKDTQVVRGDGTLASISSLSVGDADTLDNKHASDFALLKSWNDLINSSNEFTFVSPGYTGAVYLNYRTSSGKTDGSINQYIFGDGKGGELAYISKGYFSGKADNADKLDNYHESDFFRYRGALYQKHDYNANTLGIGEYVFRSSGYGSVGTGANHVNALNENSTIQVFKWLQMSAAAWSDNMSYRLSWTGETSTQRPDGWSPWITFVSSSNYIDYVNTTNFPGLNKVGTVTSVTVSGSNGLSGSGTVTTSGTITLSNAGVRSTIINGNYLRVNTNGTIADLTIPYATNADTVDGLHAKDFSRSFSGSKSSTAAQYILIGTLPASNSSTYDSFYIDGTCGGWASNGKVHFSISVGRRERISFKGYASNYNTSTFNIGVNSSGEICMYLSAQYVSWTFNVHTVQGTINYKYPHTPADTTFTWLSDSNNITTMDEYGVVAYSKRLKGRGETNNYNIQHHWTGSYWYLRGYYNDDFHAEVQVGHALNATNIYVTQHTGNNAEYPLVWSNEANAETKLANQLYKSYYDLTYNPGVKAITTGQFKANNSYGPHFTGTSTAGNWAYLRLNNSSSIWDIATNSSSGSGGLWLSRYGGNDNGIFVSANTTPKVGINTSSPSHVLHVAGTAGVIGGILTQSHKNHWLDTATVIIGRSDTTAYSTASCIGTTDGNLHLDPYKNKNLYLNYYCPGEGSTQGRTYFNGSTYYIKGGYYNGTAEYANDSDKLDGKTSTDFVFRTQLGYYINAFTFNNGQTDAGWYYIGYFYGSSGGIKIECDYTSHCANDFGICASHLMVGVRPYTLEGFISKSKGTQGGLYIVESNDSGYKYYHVYIYIKAWYQGQVRIQNMGASFEWAQTYTAPNSAFTVRLDTRTLEGTYACHNGELKRIDYDHIHAGNIGSQSVNYANSAGNADTLIINGTTAEDSCIPPYNRVGCYYSSPCTAQTSDAFILAFNVNNYIAQLAIDVDNTNKMAVRMRNPSNTYTSWASIITSENIGSQSVNYANSAGNADTVDGQNFSYSNESNSPTYLWGTNSNGTSFLAARGSISVNYASSAGNADNADTVDNKHASDFAASNCGVWPTRSFTKSLAPTTSWQDTGITTNDLSDGEGAYLIFLNPNHSNGNDGWVPRYAGLFSNMSGTNGYETEEIILQASSHASYKRLFLRFINTPNTLGYRKLQIRAASNYTSSYNMIFNIRRIV